MDLSVAIITWNAKEKLKNCLHSVARQVQNIEYEIIVADNGSSDGTAEMLDEEFSDLAVIKNRENIGVSRARNQLMRIANGRYILILDDDTELMTSKIHELTAYMDKHKMLGIAGAKLMSVDDELQLSCRTFPKPIHVLFRKLGFLKAVRNGKTLAKHQMSSWKHDSIRKVQFVIGAFQMIRKSCIDSIGPLDEKMFYGFEDADYCARVQRAGYDVIYYPDVVVKHYERRMTYRAFLTKKAVINYRSYLRFYLKHRRFISKFHLS